MGRNGETQSKEKGFPCPIAYNYENSTPIEPLKRFDNGIFPHRLVENAKRLGE